MKPRPECAAVVLAAGASTRLGAPKQLEQYRGESLLRRSVRICVQAGCRPVIVVLGYEPARMALEVSGLEPITVVNSEWQSGMASSVRTGIAALCASSREIERSLLMVCDQPLVDAELLMNLIDVSASTDASAAACSYAGVVGVPAIFARRMWPQLLSLDGDRGARQLLEECKDVATVEFGGGAIDIDTPDDLGALQD